MKQRTIATVVGSLRRESFNRRLARGIQQLARVHHFVHLEIGDLPLYNQDDDPNPPAEAVRLKTAIRAADAVIFVTPEYNRSIPGVLKNAIDHASRPYGDNAWEGKPAGVIGASAGAAGTAMAQQHLRNVLAYLDVPVLGQPEAFIQVKDDTFTADGALGDKVRPFIQKWVEAYLSFVELHLAAA
ncbi:MAG: NAD(P)H-dependent oxidoreductase [Novosphingobium sp.]|nr:NAD(P)H-dependent oxidoreductase [Novosphingobium sp.]